MRWRELAAAAVAATAAGLIAWAPGTASADSPVPTGWWQVLRQTTPVGAVPAAPVPDDGSLPVQNGPGGVLAFSALRFDVGDATAGTLTLAYSGQAPPVPPAIDACATRTHWNPDPNQEWDTRPEYDCGTHAVGTTEGAKVVWQVGSGFIRDGVLDVVLVPESGDPTPYAVSFAAPTRSAVVMASPPPPFNPPASSAGPAAAAPPSGPVPAAPAGNVPAAPALAPVAAAPIVASPGAASTPGLAAPAVAPAADERPAGSRTVGAAALAAAAATLMVRGVGGGGARKAGRSLLQRSSTASTGTG